MEHVRFLVPFHTVFYSPHHLALALGLFAREGLEAEHATARTPNGVARALLAGEADIGLSGPMRALAVLDRGEGRLTCVGEVNSRAGFFLLARPPAREVAWRDLVGCRVLVFAEAPTPRLCLEYVLERHGINPSTVELVSDVPTGRAVELFLGGRAEFLLQGQPVTEQLLLSGQAHLAAALGPALGPLAFSAYLVTPRLATERGDVVEAALTALYRAQRWLHSHSAEEVAAAVAPSFPDLDRTVLASAVRRYLATKTWATDPLLRKQGFDALQEVLLLRGFVRRRYPYEEVVDTRRAEAAVRAVGLP